LVNRKESGFGFQQWSPDSKFVYVVDQEHGFAIDRVGIGDRNIERIAAIEVPGGVTGAGGPWMSVAPDGSPLLLRDLSIQEFYALDVDWP
jgi:hypothetical protein